MLSDKLRVLLGKTSKYSNLSVNPDFVDWKVDIVDKRLDGLSKSILNTDPDSDEHKRLVIRYQELKYICEDIFSGMAKTEDRLRKKDKEEV